jgi:hypothetical protein
MDFKKTTKKTTKTRAIISATLVIAAATFFLFPLSPQAHATPAVDIGEALASGFEAGAGEAREGGNTDLADEFSAVVDALRGADDGPPCPTCP